MAYSRFAEIYDQLMKEAPYDDWVSFTKKVFAAHTIPTSASVLDLGCGTGEIAIRLNKLGYTLTGVDYSTEMLSIAQHKAIKTGTHIHWIHQDIRHLQGFSELDAVISYCDVMNYITEDDIIADVFNRVYHSLQAEGIFIFDVHDEIYAKKQLIGHTFADNEEDITYIWECIEGEREGHLVHDLTFFKRIDENENKYIRFVETHEQQVHPVQFYEILLKKAGFTKIKYFNNFHMENDTSEENRMRNFIIAVK